MDKYLTHEAHEYRQAVKFFKGMLSLPPDKKRSREAQQHERDMLGITLEALRFAALRAENPALTRNHLKLMHGQAVYLEQPFINGGQGGIVDCRDEAILVLDHDKLYRAEWFHGLPGRYYRFPMNGVDLLALDDPKE